jgi:hypothetical protein
MSARKYTLELTAIELDALCRLLWFVHMMGLANQGRSSDLWTMGWLYSRHRAGPNGRPKPWYRACAAVGRVFRKVDDLTIEVWAKGGMPIVQRRRPEAQ